MSTKSDIEAIDQTRAMLVAAGLRTTAARTAVIRWLQSSKSPATHAEISADLVPLGIDKATVFLNLNELVKAGLLTRTEFGDQVWRFELRDPSHPDRGRHMHFVCVDCGTVTCLNDVDLITDSEEWLPGVGQVTDIMVRGHCRACE